ncbi:hypothetical protein GCM10029964_021290 [Kibdelosporangium lantanae]
MLRKFIDRITGRTVPPGFDGKLEPDEFVVAWCEVKSGATSWPPPGACGCRGRGASAGT